MIDSHLRSFHAVALHHGFSKAAHALNISQPTLSTQVRALEDRYGVELFKRSKRSVTLTAAGRELFEITARLDQAKSDAENLLEAYQGLRTGKLRIAAVGPFHATDMIVAHKQIYPQIDIEVRFGNSTQCFDRVLTFDADVAILAEVPADPRVKTIPYSNHEVVVFVNSDHPFYDRKSISIAELDGQAVVRRESGSTTRTAMETALTAHHVTVNVVLELGSREAIWKAVEQGLGVGFVANFEFVPHENLRAIPISDVKIRTSYVLAFLAEREHSRLVQNFCDVALRQVGGNE